MTSGIYCLWMMSSLLVRRLWPALRPCAPPFRLRSGSAWRLWRLCHSEFLQIYSNLVFWEEIISHKVDSDFAGRDIDTVRTHQCKLQPEMVEMAAQPAPSVISVLEKTQIINFDDPPSCSFFPIIQYLYKERQLQGYS